LFYRLCIEGEAIVRRPAAKLNQKNANSRMTLFARVRVGKIPARIAAAAGRAATGAAQA
jgi:hypothetical protein